MTRPDESHTPADEPGLRHALAHGTADLAISPAPYAAIVRDGRGLRRRRTAVRTALAVTAVVVPALTLALLPGRNPAPPPGPATDPVVVTAVPQAEFTASADAAVPRDVKVTQLKGRLSGVDAEVLVWLPPQYDDPAYRHRSFPVLEVLSNYPGSSSAWFSLLKASEQLKPMIADGTALPFILVSPRAFGLAGSSDAGCADLPGRPQAETWITGDVPQLVLDNFRAERDPRNWALAGYSAGGHCATRLALAHPDRYSAAVSLSGFNDPGMEPSSPEAQDPALREKYNPLHMLRTAAPPPRVDIYASSTEEDTLADAQALAQAAKAPTTVTVTELSGRRLTPLWRDALPDVFRWLSQRLK
ncbi:pimeloyl-ACP methyl ester carboxylesterase [Kitasatospora gansuensis]|uniref:Pimeloyl-ACP methyl ester carboxylesterase n=1 Tax=Kitasatospora gansuensis TaxID=258050 RepID=A0A7W7WKC8_9ACTN|nr:alpha/beta hydrolase-fold protein [Kitasatospora gansuensis]MBB4949875.1 pimeloyl-ACP methyl ester carboxylesterase [Kitasatospora gansuensis]